MKLRKFGVLIAIVSLFAGIAPVTIGNASSWQEHYRSGWYKVRVKKTTKVDKIKYGPAAYQNKIVGHATLHKGAVVTTGYYGREGFKWLLTSAHKYKAHKGYGYSAHFKKGSFKVLSRTN